MFGFLRGKKNQIKMMAPMTGKVVSITEAPDPVFAEKMVGDGVAIIPTEGKLVAPIEGIIVQVFPTKHAVAMKSNEGLEILIHVGIETVQLKGEGFEAHVAVGDKVVVGQTLLTFDLEYIRQNAKSIVTPVLITNMDVVAKMKTVEGEVHLGEAPILNIELSK